MDTYVLNLFTLLLKPRIEEMSSGVLGNRNMVIQSSMYSSLSVNDTFFVVVVFTCMLLHLSHI